MPLLKKSSTLYWTAHSKAKMHFYRLSEARVKRVIHSPKRVEEGIAPKTIAMMQPASIKTKNNKQAWSQEIWVMIQDEKRKGVKRRKIISAWRYPGITRLRDETTANFLKNQYREYLHNAL